MQTFEENVSNEQQDAPKAPRVSSGMMENVMRNMARQQQEKEAALLQRQQQAGFAPVTFEPFYTRSSIGKRVFVRVKATVRSCRVRSFRQPLMSTKHPDGNAPDDSTELDVLDNPITKETYPVNPQPICRFGKFYDPH